VDKSLARELSAQSTKYVTCSGNFYRPAGTLTDAKLTVKAPKTFYNQFNIEMFKVAYEEKCRVE